MRRQAQVLSWATVAVLLLAAPAYTQEEATPPEDETKDEATFIEEIVVTAEKRERNLQDVSISITAYSADDLVMAGGEYRPELYSHAAGLVRSVVRSCQGLGVHDGEAVGPGKQALDPETSSGVGFRVGPKRILDVADEP